MTQVGVADAGNTITHVDTRWNHYYMDTLLRTVSEMTLAKKTSPNLTLAKKTSPNLTLTKKTSPNLTLAKKTL